MKILDYLLRKKEYPTIIFNDEIAEKTIKVFLNKQENVKRIKEYFGLLLTNIGFNNDDTIILSSFSTKAFQIDYIVRSKNNEITDHGKFEFAFWHKSFHNMIIPKHSISVINGDTKKNYEYDFNTIPTVFMQSYTINDSETGLSFTRGFEREEYKSALENHEYIFSINVKKKFSPVHGTYSRTIKMEPYTLANEERLEEYLKNLSFPIDIVAVYKEVCKISLNNLDDYSQIDFKLINRDKKVVTDEILVEEGQKVKLTLSMGDKTITVDEKDNYSYNNRKVSAEHIPAANQKHLTLKCENIKELDELISPQEVLDDIETDVEDVKEVMQYIMKK